jgi:hypothetical protein
MTAERQTGMRPQDWFGVAVRTLGLWNILMGLGYGVALLVQGNGFPMRMNPMGNEHYYFVLGVADLLVGLILMLKADFIVRLAYRGPHQLDFADDDDDDDEPTPGA